MKPHVYTGIGSRETPTSILLLLEDLAMQLGRLNWVLRSGCAPGADSAFETGAMHVYLYDDGPKPELYVPWPRFENRLPLLARLDQPQPEAFEIAERFHPSWSQLSQGARALHARNVHQILGPDVTHPVPSRFVVCWTPRGSGSGGTGQALRIANHYGVRIIDVGTDAGHRRIRDFISAP